MSEVTDDGRWIVVDGRRWRASDPSIPGPLRSELVHELMSARRAVGVASRSGDPDGERTARARVQDAKVALGERGDPWWEPPTEGGAARRIDAALRALARHRAPEGSICPSDVARVVGGTGWRAGMGAVRDRLRRLAVEGPLEVLQKGEPVAPDAEWRGPVRARLRTDA